MLPRLQETIRFRVICAFSLVHVGLLLAIFGTARLSVISGFDVNLCLLLAGLLLLYLGTIFGAFFLIWPLVPLLKRAQEARNWWQDLGGDLPQYVELFRKALDLLRPLIKEWAHRKDSATVISAEGEAHQ